MAIVGLFVPIATPIFKSLLLLGSSTIEWHCGAYAACVGSISGATEQSEPEARSTQTSTLLHWSAQGKCSQFLSPTIFVGTLSQYISLWFVVWRKIHHPRYNRLDEVGMRFSVACDSTPFVSVVFHNTCRRLDNLLYLEGIISPLYRAQTFEVQSDGSTAYQRLQRGHERAADVTDSVHGAWLRCPLGLRVFPLTFSYESLAPHRVNL